MTGNSILHKGYRPRQLRLAPSVTRLGFFLRLTGRACRPIYPFSRHPPTPIPSFVDSSVCPRSCRCLPVPASSSLPRWSTSGTRQVRGSTGHDRRDLLARGAPGMLHPGRKWWCDPHGWIHSTVPPGRWRAIRVAPGKTAWTAARASPGRSPSEVAASPFVASVSSLRLRDGEPAE